MAFARLPDLPRNLSDDRSDTRRKPILRQVGATSEGRGWWGWVGGGLTLSASTPSQAGPPPDSMPCLGNAFPFCPEEAVSGFRIRRSGGQTRPGATRGAFYTRAAANSTACPAPEVGSGAERDPWAWRNINRTGFPLGTACFRLGFLVFSFFPPIAALQ